MTYEPGARVVIVFNPHHADANDVVARVVAFRARAGFMGCDLVDVRYVRPLDGATQEMPFATYNLTRGGRVWLIARAERHEEQARRLRALADEVGE
jgi:hypothetical protein